MMRRVVVGFLLSALSAVMLWAQVQQNPGSEQQRAAGKALYDKNCSQCHGDDGKGDGPASSFMKPRPRDFTTGKYKIRTTPTGSLPVQEDIKKIVRQGMPHTAMPAWPQFTDSQLDQLAFYLKTFYAGFSDPNRTQAPVEIPSPPSWSEESAKRGRELYVNLGCVRCHGEQGRGDGAAARQMTDELGYHLRPADLTKPWTFRGGAERQVVYRTFMTGINGTPMPSYNDPAILPMEDRWPLVDYVFSLSEDNQPHYASLVTAAAVSGPIDLDQGLEAFAEAPMARFPIIGQITEKGRDFYPSAIEVEVRAIWDEQDIAILVEWNDIFNEVTGSNDPSLAVPPFDPAAEDKRQKLGGEGGEPSSDPFADPFAQPAAPAPGESEQAPEEEFSDAVAIQVPRAMPTSARKPYFLFGDAANPVELWFVELAAQVPQTFLARGSVSVTPDDAGEPFEVRASYDQGRWSVIYKRKRLTRLSIPFDEGAFVPIAFTTWDGFNKERGNKRGLTSWYSLYMEPRDKPSPAGPMLQTGFVILLILVGIVFGVRRKQKKPT